MAVPHYTYGNQDAMTKRNHHSKRKLQTLRFMRQGIHKMAQNFGMTTTYGQHKDKIGSATVATTKQPKENSAEPEAKKLRVQAPDPKEATTKEIGTPPT
jgi:hypothetical protein